MSALQETSALEKDSDVEVNTQGNERGTESLSVCEEPNEVENLSLCVSEEPQIGVEKVDDLESPKKDLEFREHDDESDAQKDRNLDEPSHAKIHESSNFVLNTQVENEDAELDFEDDIQNTHKKSEEEEEKKSLDIEDGEDEDDGEISDGLEEGEIKDIVGEKNGSAHTSAFLNNSDSNRQFCRFYARGSCFFGPSCRFLHGHSGKEKGPHTQYTMFSSRQSSSYFYSYGPTASNFANFGDKQVYPPFPPMPASPAVEVSPVESAWERALRGAKELVKRSNRLKEQEPDFETKKLVLSMETGCDDKENEHLSHREERGDIYKRGGENTRSQKFGDAPDSHTYAFDHDRHHLRGRYFENLEIRFAGTRMERARSRPRRRLLSSERERYSPKSQNKDKDHLSLRRDDRLLNVQIRSRAVEWIDPWQRSKSTKNRDNRERRTRSRSSGSCSSASYTYSESSRTSCTYSGNSTPPSSCQSSPSRRKVSPANVGEPAKITSHFPVLKKKTTRERTSRSRSYSRSFSSRGSPSLSQSRSPSSSRSGSLSRSHSRSLSMDSVSSVSNSAHSNSSSGSDTEIHKNAHLSILRKEDKIPIENLIAAYDKTKVDSIHEPPHYSEPKPHTDVPFTSFQHLVPGNDVKTKHPSKIKLTLLNKPTTSRASYLPKKGGPVKCDIRPGFKRALSPPLATSNAKPNTIMPKKSASSRRDELLKQLKAVEDAIARKRAKFC